MNLMGAQLDSVWENKAASHARLSSLLTAFPPEPGSLVVLSETWATGFSLNVPAITETATPFTETFMAEMAAHYQITLMGGVVTTGADGRGRNECVIFDPAGRPVARYAKMHPFSYGRETEAYGRGSEVVLFEWQGGSVAPFICYDLRFPEVFRHAARLGAELFCVIANWPAIREDHWKTLLKARAIENQAYVVGVNRCGADPNAAYSGHSMVFGPFGEIVVEGGTGEQWIAARLDLLELQEYRREFPVLADIHPHYR